MKLPLAVRVLQDTVSDTKRIRLSPREISLHCEKLALAVSTTYKPDSIIAIDTGGAVPGELLGNILGIPVQHVVIKRNISIGRMYNRDSIPLRWCMSAYHHFLFQITKPVIMKGIDAPVFAEKILIVDDAFHTGATADIATAYLLGKGAGEIKIAALAYVTKRMPDFSILPKGNYCFPWSKDYISFGISD